MDGPARSETSQHGHDFEVWIGDSSLCSGRANQCITSLNAGYEHSAARRGMVPALRWGGNNIVVRFTREQIEERYGIVEKDTYQDVTLADLRYALNWFARYNDVFEAEGRNLYVLHDPRSWCKGVKVSGSLEVQQGGKKKYREVEVRSSHPVFMEPQGVSHAAKHVGFPLLATRIEASSEMLQDTKGKTGNDQSENLEISFLMMNPDIGTKGAREQNAKHSKWDEKVVATILVARQDKKDVTAQQIEALISYSEGALKAKMEDQDLRLSNTEKERAFKEYLFSNKYSDFFEKMKQAKLAEGDKSWENAVPPPMGAVNESMADPTLAGFSSVKELFEAFKASMQ
jgi:hypothetical protein